MFQNFVLSWNTFNTFLLSPIARGGVSKIRTTTLPVTANNSTVRYFRTSIPKQALPPLVALLMAKFIKYGSAIGARAAKSWWQRLSQETKLKIVERAKKYKAFTIVLFGGAGTGAYLYYDAHLQETPITKRKQFIAFTEEQFSEIAKISLQALVQQHEGKIKGKAEEKKNFQRVERVANKLLEANSDLEQIRSKKWSIAVIQDDDTLNAVVLPFGYIFVYTGILNLLSTDDELAVILGHEMSHVILNHGCETVSIVHILDILFVIPLVAIWALLPLDAFSSALSHYISSKIAKYLLELPYNRSLESEADEVGLQLAAKACFDVRAAPAVWAKMAIFTDTDDPLDIAWFSSHPKSEFRQTQFEQWLPNAYKLRENCKCSALPLRDPRDHIESYKDCRLKMIRENKERKEESVPLKT